MGQAGAHVRDSACACTVECLAAACATVWRLRGQAFGRLSPTPCLPPAGALHRRYPSGLGGIASGWGHAFSWAGAGDEGLPPKWNPGGLSRRIEMRRCGCAELVNCRGCAGMGGTGSRGLHVLTSCYSGVSTVLSTNYNRRLCAPTPAPAPLQLHAVGDRGAAARAAGCAARARQAAPGGGLRGAGAAGGLLHREPAAPIPGAWDAEPHIRRHASAFCLQMFFPMLTGQGAESPDRAPAAPARCCA